MDQVAAAPDDVPDQSVVSSTTKARVVDAGLVSHQADTEAGAAPHDALIDPP
ncbi:hypothetical protein ACF1GT_14805 [Streptomyces sp. NPDC014636]|uniref:hypothetical protein n=1 Tax=Streptomyces sp. NPDC014636 TaxID=3364876 RepID=UPI0036FDD8FB